MLYNKLTNTVARTTPQKANRSIKTWQLRH